jgi:Leishmanolysin/Bacterial Ig-like domain (group 1)/Bacterial Ig-like domain (group 2)
MAVTPDRRRAPATALLLALFVAGCGGGSEPSVPSAIALAPTAITMTAIGQQQQLSAAITDQRGDPVDASEAGWSTGNSAVATVSPTGLVTATGSGTTQITATVGSIAAVATVSVTQEVASFQVAGGEGQNGGAGTALAQPLAVRALDALGNPIQGLAVTFAVTQGGGSVQPANTTTGLDGRASTTFTLGPTIGQPQQVTATLAGTALVITFTATATAAFDIQVRYLTTPSTAQAEAFADAETRWESLITGDLPNLQANAIAGSCGENSPALNEMVDDLIIFVTLEPIDGPGAVLGAAGPCFIRVPGSLTVVGRMRFDTDDLEAMENAGVLGDVIIHEMGHVLGIGTLWSQPEFDLLQNPALGTPPGTDPHFTGTGAIAAFNAAGGNTYVGQKVPVEDTGGAGTADSHWRESVLDTELMTGFVAAAGNPLSAITVRSLADMGYAVNQAGADPFTFTPTARQGPPRPGVHLENDIISGPIYRIDRKGIVVGVVNR